MVRSLVHIVNKLLMARSEKIVQQKLGALLSKEYSTKYREFRPASSEAAKVRFRNLRACRENRTRKTRSIKRTARSNDHSDKGYVLTGPHSHWCPIFVSPFIDYRKSSPDPTQYISPELLRKSLPPPDTAPAPDASSLVQSQHVHSVPIVQNLINTGSISADTRGQSECPTSKVGISS